MSNPSPTGAEAPVGPFPDRAHAIVFRTWGMVPAHVLGRVLGVDFDVIVGMADAMGLPIQWAHRDLRHLGYVTVIRKCWRLAPPEQIARLLEWPRERWVWALENEDFLGLKLGPPSDEPSAVAPTSVAPIPWRGLVRREVDDLADGPSEAPFDFLKPTVADPPPTPVRRGETVAPLIVHGYATIHGNGTVSDLLRSYPVAYLRTLAESGVTGIWVPARLDDLVVPPWRQSGHGKSDQRRTALQQLARHLRAHGLELYLYLNEPRAVPTDEIQPAPTVGGLTRGTRHTLCIVSDDVARYVTEAVRTLYTQIPELAGAISITFSENLTHCWSDQAAALRDGPTGGLGCDLCSEAGLASVISRVNNCLYEGLQSAPSQPELIVWDWAWPDWCVESIIDQLPAGAWYMSVSEWGTPIRVGETETTVREYSMAVSAPSAETLRRWRLARHRGLRVMAKLQINVSWEMSAVPFLPLTTSVARHVSRVRDAGAQGVLAGWTLGGHPSPNLTIAGQLLNDSELSAETALERLALSLDDRQADRVRTAWEIASNAMSRFPFCTQLLYYSPLNWGPALALPSAADERPATMLGFPNSDLQRWCGPYQPEDVTTRLTEVADGFASARQLLQAGDRDLVADQATFLEVAEIHYRSTINQIRLLTREGDHRVLIEQERWLARRLCALQALDSRIGFESSNQYYYTWSDLVEKVLQTTLLIAADTGQVYGR